MNRIFPGLVLLALTACASTATQIDVRQDASADFSAYHQYRLVTQSGQSDPLLPRLDEARRLIEAAIDRDLTAKGYRKVSSGEDFRIEYVVYSSARYQQGGHDRYLFDGHVRILSGTESKLVDPVSFGTLHLHLIDARRNEPVYEAIATGLINPKEDFRPRIDPTVMRLLRPVPAALP